MTNVFLFGTLCWPELLRRVGGQTCPEGQDAVLQGFQVSWAKGHGFPAIHQVTGAVAHGMVLRGCDAAVLAYLDHYESGFGYSLHPVEVQGPGGRLQARVYLPPKGILAGEVWSLADWVRDYGALAYEASSEVMAVMGLMSAADMAQAYPMMRVRADARLKARALPSPVSSSGLVNGDVAVHQHQQPYTRFFAMQEADISVPRFDGGPAQRMFRAAYMGADSAIVLPYDPKTDRVLLVEQFRFGPFLRDDPNPWLMEPIAGRIDAGEIPEATAIRETQEEAGLTLRTLHKVHSGYSSPGGSTDYFNIYVGIADIGDDAAILAGLEGESEDIQGHILSFCEFLTLLKLGRLPVVPLAVAGYWLALNRDELRKNS
jgi:ADP-ribose pyrophosphatase